MVMGSPMDPSLFPVTMHLLLVYGLTAPVDVVAVAEVLVGEAQEIVRSPAAAVRMMFLMVFILFIFYFLVLFFACFLRISWSFFLYSLGSLMKSLVHGLQQNP